MYGIVTYYISMMKTIATDPFLAARKTVLEANSTVVTLRGHGR